MKIIVHSRFSKSNITEILRQIIPANYYTKRDNIIRSNENKFAFHNIIIPPTVL